MTADDSGSALPGHPPFLSDLAADRAAGHFDRFLAEVSANSARLVLALLERLQEDDRDLPVGP